MVTAEKAIEYLKRHNEWRMGAEIPMTEPKILGEAIDSVVDALKWKDAQKEKPEPDTEVLAEVEGFDYAKYTIVKWDGKYWLQHLPRLLKEMPFDGWFGFSGNITVKRWRYIG